LKATYIQKHNPREEGLWESKNNVLGLVTEVGGSYEDLKMLV